MAKKYERSLVMAKKEKKDKAALKAEKAEKKALKKANTTPEEKEANKSLAVKCIAAILCSVILAVSISAAFKDLAEAVKVSAPVASVGVSGGVSNSGSSDDYTPDAGTDTITPDAGTDAVTPDAGTDATTPDAGTDATTPDAGTDTGATSAPKTKAEIVSYFNTAANNAKKSAKSITKVKEENYQAGGINLGALGMFEGVVNNLIESNMGVNKEQSGRVATSAADKNAVYHVENESWASKLTEADVKSATCVENNGVYTITLTVKDDALAESYSHGSGHHGKAFSIVMPQTIKDNAGGAASLLKGLKVGYEKGSIVVTVDAKTGNLLTAKYDYVWLLHVDVFGGITAPFGLKTEYKFAW